MITGPLELQSRLSPSPRDLDFFAWVNLGAIVLFFVLFGSDFVLLPGLPVGVKGDNAEAFSLPTGESLTPGAASVVVSYRRDDVILFEDGMYNLAELRKHMQEFVRVHPGAILLVRADKQVSLQAFMDLCAMARAVGFAKVQLAAEPQRKEETSLQ